MLLHLGFLYILSDRLYQTFGQEFSGDNIHLYRYYENTKFKTLPSFGLITESVTECVLNCQISNCCAVNFFKPTKLCFLLQTGCYDVNDTQWSLGWHVLRKGSETTVYVSKNKTWDDAQVYCSALGGNLATVTTAAKHQLIQSWTDGKTDVWVGASDRHEEGNWTWYNPARHVLLNYWGPDRPDNAGNIQHCMCYHQFSMYQWEDRPCWDQYYFICDL